MRSIPAHPALCVLLLTAVAGGALAADPEENKALVREYIEDVLNQGNLERLESFVPSEPSEPDARYHALTPETVRGGFELRRSVFPDLTYQIQEVLAAEGDRVVVRFIAMGTQTGSGHGGPPTGRSAEIPGVFIYRVQDGKIVGRWELDDQLPIYRATGHEIVPPAEE